MREMRFTPGQGYGVPDRLLIPVQQVVGGLSARIMSPTLQDPFPLRGHLLGGHLLNTCPAQGVEPAHCLGIPPHAQRPHEEETVAHTASEHPGLHATSRIGTARGYGVSFRDDGNTLPLDSGVTGARHSERTEHSTEQNASKQ